MSHVRQRFLLAALVATVTIAHAQSEPFRPQFHFTPERNWMNDPNGLVFYEGEWHLFDQYNPSGDRWGDMPWGHVCRRGRGAKQCSPSSSSPLRDRACSV